MARRKTPEECDWIAEHYPHMSNAELISAFRERFGWEPSPTGLASWASDQGLRKAGRKVSWREHPEYDDFLRSYIPGHTEGEIIGAFRERFGLTLTNAQVGNAKQRLGIRSGTTGGRFRPGNVPVNKGRTWDEMGIPEECQERMRRGQFKRGHLPWTTRPFGEERMTRDGYVEVHVAQRRSERANDQWVLKQRLVWERANGRKLAPDEMVVFADGDKTNFDPNNLVAVTRAEHAVINTQGIPYADRATLETAVNIARLKLGISAAERRPRTCRACGQTFTPRFARQRTCDACLEKRKIGASS